MRPRRPSRGAPRPAPHSPARRTSTAASHLHCPRLLLLSVQSARHAALAASHSSDRPQPRSVRAGDSRVAERAPAPSAGSAAALASCQLVPRPTSSLDPPPCAKKADGASTLQGLLASTGTPAYPSHSSATRPGASRATCSVGSSGRSAWSAGLPSRDHLLPRHNGNSAMGMPIAPTTQPCNTTAGPAAHCGDKLAAACRGEAVRGSRRCRGVRDGG
jgi:hypothetical protein